MSKPAPDPRVSVALLKLTEAERALHDIGATDGAVKVRAIRDELDRAVRQAHTWKRLADFVGGDT